MEIADTILEPRAFDRNPQTAEAALEQLLIRQRLAAERACADNGTETYNSESTVSKVRLISAHCFISNELLLFEYSGPSRSRNRASVAID